MYLMELALSGLIDPKPSGICDIRQVYKQWPQPGLDLFDSGSLMQLIQAAIMDNTAFNDGLLCRAIRKIPKEPLMSGPQNEWDRPTRTWAADTLGALSASILSRYALRTVSPGSPVPVRLPNPEHFRCGGQLGVEVIRWAQSVEPDGPVRWLQQHNPIQIVVNIDVGIAWFCDREAGGGVSLNSIRPPHVAPVVRSLVLELLARPPVSDQNLILTELRQLAATGVRL